MTAKNMKRVAFYLDSETQAALNKIPHFFKSHAVRNAIRKGAREGWLNPMVHDSTGSATPVPTPQSKPDAVPPVKTAPPAPPIQPPVQHSVADLEEIPVGVQPPSAPSGIDRTDELDENDPANYEEAFTEETRAIPPLEVVNFAPVEEAPAAAKEVEKEEKPARQFRSVQDMIEAQIKL